MGKEKKQQTPDKQQKDSRLMFFSKSRKKHKKLFIVIIILLGLAIGGGGFFIYTNFFNKSDNTNTSSEIKVDSTLSTKASEIAAKNGYSAGQEYLDQALKSASSDSEIATIYLYKASMTNDTSTDTTSSESNNSVSLNSLEYAKKAEELNPTADTAITIAFCEEKIGDISSAISYYKIYLSRISSDSDDYNYYNSRITYLESMNDENN